MTKLLAPLIAVAALLFASAARAEETPLVSVAVGQAKVKRTLAAFPSFLAPAGSESKFNDLREIALADLDFSGLFDFLAPAAFVEDPTKAGIAPGTFKLQDWSSVGAELLIKGKGSVEAGTYVLDLFVYAVGPGKQLLAKRFRAKDDGLRKLAHAVSDDVMLALTGRKGPFTSRIAFVSDKTGRKEIYVMDYDGFNPTKVTSHFLHALSPAWSPDGKKLAFTAITKNAKNVRNYTLYEYDLSQGGRPRMLSNRKGMNSGSAYSPDGKQIALTMSHTGHPSLFLLDVESLAVRQLTSSYGVDVDPAWSPDGKQLAFVSDRAGKSMVYRMDAAGGNSQRLTYAGQYNASPSWSPLGDKIAFAGWDGPDVDIFVMDADGSNLERLTRKQGRNEDPAFAPDGYFLAYTSSNHKGKKNIFLTNLDNTVHRQITKDFGNCESPKWSP